MDIEILPDQTDALSEIIDKGLTKLNMTIQGDAKHQIGKLSQGLPYYTHALALHASEHAIESDRTEINMEDVHHAIEEIVGKRGHSNLQNYLKATRSSHKDSLYASVLLACAFTDADELGYFSASDVREPLSRIMEKQYEIPAYARHLNQFCEEAKGQILKKERVGTSKRFKYRFTDPQMRPFVTLNGLAKHQIDIDTWKMLSGMN